MKARESLFPKDVDSRSYFSDVSLMNRDVLSEHHTLISLRRYQEASQKLHDSGISYYSAELFNFLEDCLVKIGQILQHKTTTPTRPVYSQTYPEKRQENMIWISGMTIDA